MIRFLVLAVALFLTGCMPEPAVTPGESTEDRASFEQRQQSCRADGGQFVTALIPPPDGGICVLPTKDAGAACLSSADCEGHCLPAGTGSGGQCSAKAPIVGCFKVFENGQTAILCVD